MFSKSLLRYRSSLQLLKCTTTTTNSNLCCSNNAFSTSTNSSSTTTTTSIHGVSPTPFYSPSLTEKRFGEAGRGGRSSEAGCKVAVFGGSGFLGGFVCAELGTK